MNECEYEWDIYERKSRQKWVHTQVTIHNIWIKGRTHEDILKVICFSESRTLSCQFRSRETARLLKKIFFKIIYLFNFIVDIFTDIPIPPPLLAPTHPPIPLSSGHHHTVVWVYGLCIYVIRLIPSPSFI